MSATTVTPYGAAKLVNEHLAECNIDKQLPPQMFYNYTTARIRAGKSPLIACDESGKIELDALAAWLEKYVAKQTVTA
jgi:hypothetical protein